MPLMRDENGEFVRSASTLRRWIGRDPELPATPGRYHLFIMEGCPWAHRTWLTRRLKGLEPVLPMSRCRPMPAEQGWCFEPTGRYEDRLYGSAYLHEVYSRTSPGFTGRITVPLLVDVETGRAVNNESADIVRMLDAAFESDAPRLCPPELEAEIDAVNARVYAGLNDGVYAAGFAQSEEAHHAAVHRVFDTLAWMDARLGERRFLCGEALTEADVRAFPTLVRFDAAYVTAFGCSLGRLTDYPNVWAYARDLYQHPGFAETVLPLELYQRGYHSIPIAVGHRTIVPPLPPIDFEAPHGRGDRFATPAVQWTREVRT